MSSFKEEVVTHGVRYKSWVSLQYSLVKRTILPECSAISSTHNKIWVYLQTNRNFRSFCTLIFCANNMHGCTNEWSFWTKWYGSTPAIDYPFLDEISSSVLCCLEYCTNINKGVRRTFSKAKERRNQSIGAAFPFQIGIRPNGPAKPRRRPQNVSSKRRASVRRLGGS